MTDYSLDDLSWTALPCGGQRAELLLRAGDTAPNPSSTKRPIRGPGKLTYRRFMDGGIDLTARPAPELEWERLQELPLEVRQTLGRLAAQLRAAWDVHELEWINYMIQETIDDEGQPFAPPIYSPLPLRQLEELLLGVKLGKNGAPRALAESVAARLSALA